MIEDRQDQELDQPAADAAPESEDAVEDAGLVAGVPPSRPAGLVAGVPPSRPAGSPSEDVVRDEGAPDEGDEDRAPARPEDVATVAEEFVGGLLEAMGLEAEIQSSVEGESASVDVTGEGLGILIGRRGQTLDALQEVARTAVQRRLRARIRLLVDVEGYRARRRSSLADYAKAMALRAKERGTEIELEPMTAYERKIVHDAVAEVDGASSFSEGAEPYRKVVVRGE